MSNAAAFDELARLRLRLKSTSLGSMSPPAVAAKQAIVEVSLKLIRKGFLGEQAPDGRPWAPKKVDDGPILKKTGKLMRSWSGRPTIRGISLKNTAPYVSYHQYGYYQPHYLVARSMVPNPNASTLPKAWLDAWNDAAHKAFERYLRL